MTVALASNLLIFTITAAILVAAFSSHERRIGTSTADASRFVTAEWRLLQQLKEETDQQLAAKEREIAALRRRYLDLVDAGAGVDERRQMEAEIRAAEAERDAIVAVRIDRERLLVPDESDPEAISSDAGIRAALDSIATDRVGPVAPETEHPPGGIPLEPVAETADDALFAVGLVSAVRQLEEEVALMSSQLDEERARVAELAARLEAAQSEAEDAAGGLRSAPVFGSEALPGEPSEDASRVGNERMIELVNARALVRAIVDSPPIRSEYPGLADELDRYVEERGREQQQRGRADAYASASEAIEALAASIGVRVDAGTPRESAEGFVERLIELAEHAVRVGVPRE